MTARPQVSIRLSTDGKAQVQRDLADVGAAGDAAAQRIARSFERDSASAEAALTKLARTQERLQAISQTQLQQTIGRSTSTGFGDPSGSARASALAMEQQFARGEQAARQMLASIDPLFAAQMRYNQAIEQTNLLEAQGVQIEGGFARVRAGLKTQLDETTQLYGKQGAAIGNTRIAQMEMMHVVRGSVDQFAAGAPPMQIFTMHLGMIGQAAALSGESMGKFGAFMSSGWGLALTVAVVALAPLVAKLGDAGNEVDHLVDKLKEEAKQQALNDQAHRLFIHTLAGVEQVVRDVNKAYDDYENRLKSSGQASLDHAKAALKDAQAVNAQAQAALNAAKADQARLLANAAANGLGTNIGSPAQAQLDAATAVANSAQNELTRSAASIVSLNGDIEKFQSIVSVENATATAVENIRKRYEGENGLIEQARKHALAQHQVGNELERQVKLLKDREAAELKAAGEKDRKPGKNEGGTAIFNDQIASFFDIANKYRGKSEGADKGVLEQFFREANINLDPEKTAWCAAFVNAVLAAGGARGTGSLAASSFLGFGKDDTSSPQKGDIVIVRSGGSPSGMHVGFLDSIDAKGNVSLLGGNTGNKVGESTYGPSDVLGVRRPPTPSETFTDQVKSAQQEQDALGKLLSKESEVSVVKEHQLNLVDQMIGKHADLQDVITSGILPSLKAWEREYQQIKASTEEATRFGEQLIDDMLDPSGWTNWRDMAMRVLHDITSELVKMSLLNPLKNAFDGGSRATVSGLLKGIGDIAGALFGGAPSGGGDFGGGSSGGGGSQGFSGPPGDAIGDEYFPGGIAWVGEHGKELVRMPRGSKISTAAESRRIAAANDGGIGSISIPISIDATGADASELARLRGELQQLKQDLPGHVVSAYYEAKQRFVIS